MCVLLKFPLKALLGVLQNPPRFLESPRPRPSGVLGNARSALADTEEGLVGSRGAEEDPEKDPEEDPERVCVCVCVCVCGPCRSL